MGKYIDMEGLRFNEGKTRHDLIPAFAQEQYAKVLTKGSEKYAARNWENGMSWSKVIASLKRHIAKIELGQDYDEETGLLHSAHVMCNAAFLTEYYKIYPQGDDRPLQFKKMPRIGLDIDDVICDFIGGFMIEFGLDEPKNWNWSYKMKECFESLSNNQRKLETFYLSLKPKINPQDIPFEPVCYITSRNVPQWITEKWIELNGFPCVPIYTVGHNVSKVEIAEKENLDIFVDDRFENFSELNNAGICTFLMDMPHNQRYNVGHKRIYSLKDLFK